MLIANFCRRELWLAAALLAGAAGTEASGQTKTEGSPAAEQSDQSVELAEIVVTAQKREQSLQDVPIAITALSQSVLENNRISNISELSSLAPGLTALPAAGGVGIPLLGMRGVLAYGDVPGQDRSVSLYIDGVYVGSPFGQAFELPDVERIEVLRGPQGTLFGRNATAGAISVVTHDPTGVFSVQQQVSYGNYEHVRVKTHVDSPTWGPLSASVSYVHESRNGDINNLGAGQVWDRSSPDTHQGVESSPRTLGDRDAGGVCGGTAGVAGQRRLDL